MVSNAHSVLASFLLKSIDFAMIVIPYPYMFIDTVSSACYDEENHI